MKDFYSVLGTDVNSTPSDIREAYRKLSKKFHPDLNENDPYFENRFREIREAYDVLSDPTLRSQYDNQLKKAKVYMPAAGEPKKLTKGSVNTKINWAFTAILLIITSLFGYYVVRSVTHTKAVKPPFIASIEEVAPVHHKRHNHLKSKKAETPEISQTQIKSKSIADTASTRIAKIMNKALAQQAAVTEKPKPAPITTPLATVTVKPAGPPVIDPQEAKSIPVQSTTVISARPVQQNTSPGTFVKPTQQNSAAAINPTKATPINTVASNVTPANTDAYIKANATGVVYMRSTNNYNSDVVNVIPGDTKVTVLEKGSNFYKIAYNNKTGYVPNWTVQFK